jgi:hypothetical protein
MELLLAHLKPLSQNALGMATKISSKISLMKGESHVNATGISSHVHFELFTVHTVRKM